MPRHENLDMKLPKKAVFAFLGEHIDIYARKHECKKVGEFVSATKIYPIYVTHYKGEDIMSKLIKQAEQLYELYQEHPEYFDLDATDLGKLNGHAAVEIDDYLEEDPIELRRYGRGRCHGEEI